MHLADRIQDLRKIEGLSQEDLANKLGVSRQAVSKWESEQSTPDIEKIIHMSELFGVTTDYILKGTETIKIGDKKALYLALIVICSILACIWSALANRFQYYEILLIAIAGAAIGFCVGLLIQVIPRVLKK